MKSVVFLWTLCCASALAAEILELEELQRRQDRDSRLVQDALKLAQDRHSEVTALREEMQSMRSELDRLRGGNQAKNDHLTVGWLSGAVAELRSEVAELSGAVNRTEELAARAALAEAVRLVRSDLTGLRADVADQGGRIALLEDQAKAGVNEAEANKEANWALQHAGSEESKRYRHQRLLKKRLETVTSAHARLEKRVVLLEKKMHARLPPLPPLAVLSNDVIGDGELSARVAKLELTDRKTDKAMFNVTRQVAGLSRLHASMLELLESVEGLEAKVDSTVPEFRREISRLEFTMAQTSSTVSLVREDQENQRASVKAMGSAMSTMQDKLSLEVANLRTLEAAWANHSKAASEEPLTEPRHTSSLPVLVNRLTRLVKDYDEIVQDLPHECSMVDGPSGLYLVAVGARPLVTACDQTTGAGGWTLVQRRQDGSQEFNNKWVDYANGFGSPLGEFWIGNEALHYLTAANLSSLRIDLVDIYGKAWYAEYDQFIVANASDGYRLTVSGYHGNASDALDYQNRMQFSAIDSDRDVSNTHCAANYEGGWWFSHCQHANLNGRYNLGLTWFDSSRNEWIAVARSEMKVRSRQRHRTTA